MAFPITRPRRLRGSAVLRDMLCETRVDPACLIAPLFVVPGERVLREVSSMPGQFQMSIDVASKKAAELFDIGIKSVILFGIPETKDDTGSYAWNRQGVIPRAIAAIKRAAPEMMVITDLCFCEYTSHGHCGVMKNGALDNDETLGNLAKQALVHAEAGVDMIAPSGMIDGMIITLRRALDEQRFKEIPLMSYAVKYASSFYGPFRDAVESKPEFGDRKSYQMDPRNRSEAIREAELDLNEGADIIMVKPALAFLDIIRDVKERFNAPTAAYNVSGEYAMIMAAVRNGWLDEQRVMVEVLTSIKRAGADIIITYFAEAFARGF